MTHLFFKSAVVVSCHVKFCFLESQNGSLPQAKFNDPNEHIEGMFAPAQQHMRFRFDMLMDVNGLNSTLIQTVGASTGIYDGCLTSHVCFVYVQDSSDHNHKLLPRKAFGE